jgi:hypothetical protein
MQPAGDIMKPSFTLLPLLLAIIVLSGCPDSKMPKVPPKVPEPKAAYGGPWGTVLPDVLLGTQQRAWS